MSSTAATDAFERGTDQILPLMTEDQARALLSFQGDARLQARIEELAALSTEGELSDADRAEYEGYVRAIKFIAILQAKARKRLNSAV
ncbi:MAG: hypothetical protein B7Z55_08935 [Planctomycetales bacterium 12-60-4]|nr:MAG: hypothetical protein B7Z55_08935 [Planctomycetales bacterium 12-60-4]